MKFLLSISACLLFSQILFSQKHWESIVVASDTWNYLPSVSEPPSTWYQPAFEDNTWETGKGGFGYGDGDDATITGVVHSIYLRKKFTIGDTSIIRKLLLDIDYDDAFVLYLNGLEVARSSNVTDNPPLYNAALTIDHEAQLYQGYLPERHILETSALIQGENTIAVHIINNGTTSTDMSGLVFLNAEINSSDIIYQSTPSWFWEPVNADESNLPLIMINTLGQTIQDEPKITARMSVINNPGGINNINDTAFEYNGYIAVEIRGSSSLMFDKKNFNVETRTDSGTNLNVPLLGLPEENDWVLHGPYSDKSLMRNVLAYHLGNLTGRWSPRTRFCELYIDNDYRGVYVLIEKIKRDKNRVAIATLNPDETSGDELTGGYILKIDRADVGAWISPYKGRNGVDDIPISYVKPEYADMPDQQCIYIKEYITDFENALHGEDFKDPINGYRPYIDITSFADYYLINELSRNVDAYRLSSFFYKDKDSNGGKLTMGPLWDFNLGFGNADYYSGVYTDGWVLDGIGAGDGFQPPFWWDRLREDSYFEAQLRIRWDQLRSDKFSNENIDAFIDSCAAILATAQQRNFQRFNILSTYIWPNAYIGGSYANEVIFLKDWVSERLSWMDSQIDLISAVNEPSSSYANSLEIFTYPNPFTESVTLHANLFKNANVDIVIRNILGETIINLSKECSEGIHEFTFEAPEFNEGANFYFYELIVDGEHVQSGKMIKK